MEYGQAPTRLRRLEYEMEIGIISYMFVRSETTHHTNFTLTIQKKRVRSLMGQAVPE
jgi:hypothetical protein